jgi:hypothetical protein
MPSQHQRLGGFGAPGCHRLKLQSNYNCAMQPNVAENLSIWQINLHALVPPYEKLCRTLKCIRLRARGALIHLSAGQM